MFHIIWLFYLSEILDVRKGLRLYLSCIYLVEDKYITPWQSINYNLLSHTSMLCYINNITIIEHSIKNVINNKNFIPHWKLINYVCSTSMFEDTIYLTNSQDLQCLCSLWNEQLVLYTELYFNYYCHIINFLNCIFLLNTFCDCLIFLQLDIEDNYNRKRYHITVYHKWLNMLQI